MAPFFGLNAVGENLFYLRAKTDKTIFVHRVRQQEKNGEMTFIAMHGEENAEMFTRVSAESFLSHLPPTHQLEIVSVLEVLGPDCTLN